MPELTSHKSMALSLIQPGKLLSFGTLALHSGHCSALFGFAINPEIPTPYQRKYFSFSQNRLQRWTAVKTLDVLYLLRINSLCLRQINKKRRNSEVWCLNTSNTVCERSPKHMFTSEGLCGSPNSIVFEKSKVRLRNTAHPCKSLLWIYPTSEAIKNAFIEGGGGL